MRFGTWRGVAPVVAFALAAVIATGVVATAKVQAGLIIHTIPREVDAVDVNTGGEYFAPPVPYGCYAKDPLGALAKACGLVKGLVHGCCPTAAAPAAICAGGPASAATATSAWDRVTPAVKSASAAASVSGDRCSTAAPTPAFPAAGASAAPRLRSRPAASSGRRPRSVRASRHRCRSSRRKRCAPHLKWAAASRAARSRCVTSTGWVMGAMLAMGWVVGSAMVGARGTAATPAPPAAARAAAFAVEPAASCTACWPSCSMSAISNTSSALAARSRSLRAMSPTS